MMMPFTALHPFHLIKHQVLINTFYKILLQQTQILKRSFLFLSLQIDCTNNYQPSGFTFFLCTFCNGDVPQVFTDRLKFFHHCVHASNLSVISSRFVFSFHIKSHEDIRLDTINRDGSVTYFFALFHSVKQFASIYSRVTDDHRQLLLEYYLSNFH